MDPLEAAGEMNEALKQMSDMLKGAIKVLTDEGWTEPEAKEIAFAVYLSPFRKGK
jgi:hypothetical protein